MLNKIAEMFGADPIHYRQLLKVEKTVTTHALAEKRGFVNASLGVTCIFCLIFSTLIAATLFFLSLDMFSYTLLALTCTMMLVVFWSLPHFDIILSPTNYLVLAHTPVSSRTYFIVKLTQLLTYAVVLLGCLNLLPAILGLWTKERNPFFPVVYLPISFIAGFFMIGLMTVFAGYLTKLYTKERFRNIAQYAQLAFVILLPSISFVPYFFRGLMTDKVVSLFKAFYLLPNSWFAGAVSLTLGNVHRQALILTALAIASTVLLVAGPLRSIAKGYSKYLTSLLESRKTRSTQLTVKTSVLARLFRRRETYAASDLVFAYLRRDRHTQLRFFPSLAGVVIIPIILFHDRDLSLNLLLEWAGQPFTIWFALGVSALFFFVGSGFTGSFLSLIRYSEHWNAAWMFRCAPLATPHALWRSAQATALVYIVFPYTLLLTTIVTLLWPLFWGGFYLLPGLTGLLCYVVFYPKPSSGLPLSQEYIQSERYLAIIPFLCSLLVFGAVLALQFAMYRIHLGLYMSCYSVTVIAGFLLFIYFFTKKERQFSKNQIGAEAYAPNPI